MRRRPLRARSAHPRHGRVQEDLRGTPPNPSAIAPRNHDWGDQKASIAGWIGLRTSISSPRIVCDRENWPTGSPYGAPRRSTCSRRSTPDTRFALHRARELSERNTLRRGWAGGPHRDSLNDISPGFAPARNRHAVGCSRGWRSSPCRGLAGGASHLGCRPCCSSCPTKRAGRGPTGRRRGCSPQSRRSSPRQ